MSYDDPSLDDFAGILSELNSNDSVSGELGDTLAISGGGMTVALSTANENIDQDYCIRWNGSPVGTMRFAGPSPEDIADLVQALVRLANRYQQSIGQPALWGASLGAC